MTNDDFRMIQREFDKFAAYYSPQTTKSLVNRIEGLQVLYEMVLTHYPDSKVWREKILRKADWYTKRLITFNPKFWTFE